MKLIDSLRPANAEWLYEHMRETKPVVVVFEIDEDAAGVLCGRRVHDEIVVDFIADTRGDDGLTYAFSREGVAKGHNLKMLAWREWEGAWRVLDPRVSALLPTVDAYAEGDRHGDRDQQEEP